MVEGNMVARTFLITPGQVEFLDKHGCVRLPKNEIVRRALDAYIKASTPKGE